MRIGLTSVTFRKIGAKEIAEFAAKNGITCIEWGADVHARPDDAASLDNIVSLCKEYGIDPISYGSYYRAGVENEFTASEVIAAAKRLGAKRIRVWAGVKEPDTVSKTEFDRMVADLKNFTELASKENITVATEFHHGTYTVAAKSALSLLRAVDGLKTYWQENPRISALDNYGELTALLPYVETVHAFCFDAQLNRYPLSAAKERWREYIRAVRGERKTDMPFLLEFVKNDSMEQAAEDARVLGKWLEENA